MAEHGTKYGYEAGCRLECCKAAWRVYYRTRSRAVARLVKAHRDEFARYWAEEKSRISA